MWGIPDVYFGDSGIGTLHVQIKTRRKQLRIFEKSAPDYFGVIYMNGMMPRMNGLDAARTIWEMKRREDAGGSTIIYNIQQMPLQKTLSTAGWLE